MFIEFSNSAIHSLLIGRVSFSECFTKCSSNLFTVFCGTPYMDSYTTASYMVHDKSI